MNKIPLLLTLIALLFGNELLGQKKYSFSGEFHYLIKPFNQFNFGAKEVEFNPFRLQNELNYQIGLRAARVKNNNEWFVQAYFTHLSARWEHELFNYDPVHVLLNFERSLDANGVDLGIGYTRKVNRFKFSSAVFLNAMMPYDIQGEYNSQIGSILYITIDPFTNVKTLDARIDEKFEGAVSLNVNCTFSVAYHYTKRCAIHVAVNYAPWNKNLIYYKMKIRAASGDEVDWTTEIKTLVNRELAANWLYPKIGISYDF